MSKTISFNEEKERLDLYKKSYLKIFQNELEKDKKALLAEFSKSHSEEEIINKEKELDVINKQKYLKEENRIANKNDKKVLHKYKKETINQRRIWEIDFIRGIIIVGMLIDHFFYDFIGVFTYPNFTNLPDGFHSITNFANAYWVFPFRVAIRLLGIYLLMFISGVSTRFSKNSIKRSLFIIGAGLIISVAFYFVSLVEDNPSDRIIIGAVMAIGICQLLYSLWKKALHKLKIYKWLTLAVAIAILVGWGFVAYSINVGKGDWNHFWFIYHAHGSNIPHVYWEDLKTDWWQVLLGTRYFGSDWMGIFPGLGYMFLGGFLGELLYKNPRGLLGKYNESFNRYTIPFTFAGRNSLWFYLLHQPIYIIIIGAIALLMGAKINF